MFFKAIKSAEEHIALVQRERVHYHECLDTSSTNIKASFPVVPSPGSCLPANSTDATIHYSFDMAQQVRTSILYSCQCIRAETNTKFNASIADNILGQEHKYIAR